MVFRGCTKNIIYICAYVYWEGYILFIRFSKESLKWLRTTALGYKKGFKYCEFKGEIKKTTTISLVLTPTENAERVFEGMHLLQKGLKSQTVLHLQVSF